MDRIISSMHALVKLTLLLPFAVGCHHLPISIHCGSQSNCGRAGSTSDSCCTNSFLFDGDSTEGVVRTGGQFARAKAIPISSQGMTLAEAVNFSIREPLLRSQSTDLVSAYSRERSPSLSSLLSYTPEELAKELMKDVQKSDNDEIMQKTNKYIASIEKEYRFSDSEVELLRANVFAMLREARNELHAAVENDLHRPDDGDVVSSTSLFDPQILSQGQSQEKWSEKVLAEVASYISPLADDQSYSAAQQRTEAPVQTYFQAAVKLTRKSGGSMVFPLWLVQQFQAGDVALRDGDIVSIMHYSRTGIIDPSKESLSGKSKDLNRLLNSQLGPRASELSSFIDMYRVARLGPSGAPEVFYIPRETERLFGAERGYSFVIDNASVGSSDVVKPGTLDLEPVIRLGRREAIKRSMDGLQEQTCLEQFDEEYRRIYAKFEQLPLIGSGCSLVESTTGFDSSQIISNASECLNETCESVTNVVGF